MFLARGWLAKINLSWQKLNPSSLQVRLTLGITAFSILGLGSLAIWTSMRLQQILIASHKENIHYISDRFPQDLKIYSDMLPQPEGRQKAVDNLTTGNRVLWIKDADGQITAKSAALQTGKIRTTLLTLNSVPSSPQVKEINGGYWILCATPVRVNNVNLGELYIAQDITDERMMFLNLVRNLSVATLIIITIMTSAIAYYINRSIRPLQRISQLTEKISADKLADARIDLDNAPSEVKELAQTFDQMLVRLGEAWEHQRQLLSNVSHELRTPLTIISGYLQSTLRRSDNLTEIQREALSVAASEAERTIQLLKDLLDLARADSGRMHFQLECLVLNDLVQEVTAMARQYSARPIQIELATETISIKADINRLKQILLNLIDNAVKYSDNGQPITLKLDKQDNCGIIQVCDRGIGIPLSQQTRIFERFYRVEEARHRSGGTGLGLSIVKTIVEGMGGSISVRSQLAQGSTFTVSFPLI
jgi:signal transduction histidine kinase